MNDEQLALSIGRAVLNAIKAYQPQIERVRVEYETPKQLAETFGKSTRTVYRLISEIREQVAAGRYPDDSILDGCGVFARVDVFTDYLRRRKHEQT